MFAEQQCLTGWITINTHNDTLHGLGAASLDPLDPAALLRAWPRFTPRQSLSISMVEVRGRDTWRMMHSSEEQILAAADSVSQWNTKTERWTVSRDRLTPRTLLARAHPTSIGHGMDHREATGFQSLARHFHSFESPPPALCTSNSRSVNATVCAHLARTQSNGAGFADQAQGLLAGHAWRTIRSHTAPADSWRGCSRSHPRSRLLKDLCFGSHARPVWTG